VSTIWNYLRRILTEEPAILAWAAGGGLAMLSAYWLHFSKTQEAAAAAVLTALAAVVTAIATREKLVSVIPGALAAILAAAGAFGYHLPPKTIAMILAAASVLLGLVFRANVTPVALARKRAAAAVRAVPEPSRHLINPQGSL
jgi:hypothetical protein